MTRLAVGLISMMVVGCTTFHEGYDRSAHNEGGPQSIAREDVVKLLVDVCTVAVQEWGENAAECNQWAKAELAAFDERQRTHAHFDPHAADDTGLDWGGLPESASSQAGSSWSWPTYIPSGRTSENAYGPGVNSDATGRPFTWQPQYGSTGHPDPTLRVQPNAYGLGIGMDQYGRPVQAQPWP